MTTEELERLRTMWKAYKAYFGKIEQLRQRLKEKEATNGRP